MPRPICNLGLFGDSVGGLACNKWLYDWLNMDLFSIGTWGQLIWCEIQNPTLCNFIGKRSQSNTNASKHCFTNDQTRSKTNAIFICIYTKEEVVVNCMFGSTFIVNLYVTCLHHSYIAINTKEVVRAILIYIYIYCFLYFHEDSANQLLLPHLYHLLAFDFIGMNYTLQIESSFRIRRLWWNRILQSSSRPHLEGQNCADRSFWKRLLQRYDI